jgi:hypothetical protein
MVAALRMVMVRGFVMARTRQNAGMPGMGFVAVETRLNATVTGFGLLARTQTMIEA